MKWHIHQTDDALRGVNIVVQLYDFERDDHAIIHQHNMVNVPVCQHEKRPPDLFGKFYTPASGFISVHPMDDRYRAHFFEDQIHRGLTSFVGLMDKNRATYKPYPRDPEPFNFYEQYRMRHQWVLGDSGSGKTTFLANLLAQDLHKVAQGEASLVVLDSQDDELTRYLPRDRRFAPGGDLHGRLVYLEYDSKHPLAFNIFANPDAAELCDFVMKSVIGADVTMKQNVFYEYLLTAASIIPGANIYTVQDLLRPGGDKLFGPYLNKLDARAQHWLKNRFDADIFAQTKEEILYRLEAFTSPRNILGNMLASSQDKFDLGKEIQAGKVVVLNTNRSKLGKQGTRALGRFFIFKVLQAMEDRMDIDRSARLPTFFYIDEATDYIEDDDSLPDLLEKARKQKIGLIIAHQRTGDGSRISKNVQAALSGIYIQARLFQPKTATVTLKDSPTNPTVKDVIVPEIHLDRTQMPRDDWNAIIAEMRTNYCYDPAQASSPSSDPPPGKKKRRHDSHDRP
jgi:hypothetical protein